tara:strand:- start:440 stop:1945 length:1506 start_codon:yes stop_codon:yes gene_type:complete
MLTKNKNSFLLYTGGLIFGLILLNLIARDKFHRFDLTDNQMYSLSLSSKSIVSKVDDLLTMKVYFSDNLPNELGNTRRFLQDILEEFSAYSENNIRFFFHNPESDKDLEEQARKDGIQPVQMQVIENDKVEIKKVYLGMVLLFEDKKEVIPVIQTTSGLEYLISTKIKSLIDVDKKTIGLAHLDPESEMKTDNLSSQLSQHYSFRNINLNETLNQDIDVYLVTGAVDTLDSLVRENLISILQSGKKVFLAQSGIATDIQTQTATPINSDIYGFLKDYGINLMQNLVLDGKCNKVQVQERRGIFMMNRPMDYPFFPIVQSFNENEIVVSDLEQLLPLFPSEIQIDTTENERIAGVVELFKSSGNSGLMEGNWILSPDPQQNPFIRMLGQEGKLLSVTSKLVNGGELMLISDSKFLSDEGGMSINDNLVFIMNAVDYLAGDEDLISLRSREITNRPLEELEDSTKKKWKWANMLLPSILVLTFGFFQMRKEKNNAEILRQIYD